MQNNRIENPPRVLTWNVQCKKPASPKGAAAVAYIVSEWPDIAVLTEAWIGHLGDGGHEIVSQPTPSAGKKPDERKVVMWSKTPWSDVDDLGHQGMPVGRFVAGTTETAIGPVRVMGICIPWPMANVNNGPKNAKPWELAMRWLDCFAELVANRDRDMLLVVAGDFNQRVPRRKGGNKAAAAKLEAALGDLTVVTAGTPARLQRPGIDHIAMCPRLAATRVWGWPKDDGGIKMSDHSGVAAELATW
ncbi:MAG: endonuclease/exonuclease/phosphatase family protein [Acidimicrobiales bacterium]